MPQEFLILAAYFVAVNAVTFALFAYDKYCAQRDKWRVRESTLLLFAAIGGALGAGLAMQICRHKTLHLKFKFGVPILFFLQVLIVALAVTNPGGIVQKILGALL